MAKISITHEFDEDEREEAKLLFSIGQAESVLLTVDEELRVKLKHGEEDWLETDAYAYLESIRKIIHDSGTLEAY